MMKAFLIVLAVAAAACGDATAAGDRAQPSVAIVVSTTILGDLTRQLVGDDGTVDVLLGEGADPHEFSLSAAQAESLRSADLVVVNGLGLEEGMLDALAAAADDGARVVEIADNLDPIPFAEGDEHADEEGDEHGGLDPHVWQDPSRIAAGVRLLGDELAEVDDALEDSEWTDRAEALATELEALDAEVEQLLADIPAERRVLVTNHDAFGYLAERYDFEIVATVLPGGSTLAEPSAADLEEVVAAIEEHAVPVIFTETTAPAGLAEAVAAEVGEDVAIVTLFSDALGEEGSGAETYAGMIRTNASRIAEALG